MAKNATSTETNEELHPSAGAQLQIQRIRTKTVIIPIVGTAPLIVHNFSDKSKRQMLEAQQGVKKLKVNRDPESEYEAAFYRIADEDGNNIGYGFPVLGFKAATISAARLFGKAVKMTELKQFLFFEGIITPGDPQALVPINGEPSMREDVVRLAGATRAADLRFRPQFLEWDAELKVTYIENCISLESVLSLVDAAGRTVGVGEWRPERKGESGTFIIDENRETRVIG